MSHLTIGQRALRLSIVGAAFLPPLAHIAWGLYSPDFVPSVRWIELAVAPAALLGIAIGGTCWSAMSEWAKDQPELMERLPKSPFLRLFTGMFGVAILASSLATLSAEALPYYLTADQAHTRQERTQIEGYARSRLGDGWLMSPMVATYQRRIPMDNARIGNCAREGDRVAMVGAGDWRGMHLERVIITLALGEEIVVDYRSDTVTFPERCG